MTSFGPVQPDVWLQTRCGGHGSVSPWPGRQFQTPAVLWFHRRIGTPSLVATRIREEGMANPSLRHRRQKCSWRGA